MTHTPTPWRTRKNERECPDNLVVMRGDGTPLDGISIADFAPGTPDITFKEAEANAARNVAAVNFFHGSDIPTDRIPVGGFKELVTLVEFVGWQKCVCHDGTCPSCRASDFLTKLGVEP